MNQAKLGLINTAVANAVQLTIQSEIQGKTIMPDSELEMNNAELQAAWREAAKIPDRKKPHFQVGRTM